MTGRHTRVTIATRGAGKPSILQSGSARMDQSTAASRENTRASRASLRRKPRGCLKAGPVGEVGKPALAEHAEGAKKRNGILSSLIDHSAAASLVRLCRRE